MPADQASEGQAVNRPNVFNTQRRVVMQFEGTAREFRDFLHQISLLVEDDTYEWELTASVARHPAGHFNRRHRDVHAEDLP